MFSKQLITYGWHRWRPVTPLKLILIADIVVLVLASSLATEWLAVHLVFGAF